jgi:antitoxin HicB
MRDLSRYPFEIRPLSDEDGGGFLISFPDFSECISDGDAVDEAVANGLDALKETIAALESMGLPVPEPGSGGSYSGRFVTRMPKSLHARLAQRARHEGVSMNTLIVSLLSEGLAKRDHYDVQATRDDQEAYLMEPPAGWKKDVSQPDND